MAQQVLAAQQFDGLAITLGIEPCHVPPHPGLRLRAGHRGEHVGAALLGHLCNAQLLQGVQAFVAHLLALHGARWMAVALGRADQHQAADALLLHAAGESDGGNGPQ
ncbi:hypothetical protein D3C78_1575120 [compost metagenome]